MTFSRYVEKEELRNWRKVCFIKYTLYIFIFDEIFDNVGIQVKYVNPQHQQALHYPYMMKYI